MAAALLAAVVAGGCTQTEPARRYALSGQVLAVDAERRHVTVQHNDIPDLMPGMTMSFPVAEASLLDGLTPGDTIVGALEVNTSTGVLVAITRTGSAPLPEGTNAADLAAGILDIGDALPDAALIDQDDRRRSLSDWIGVPTLVTFIYTRCPLPNFCPLMDQNFATIQRAASEDAQLAGQIRLISISFDPDHDTPAVLAAHARRLNADPEVWTFLTGDRVTVDRIAARLGVGVVRPADGGPAITHNLRTVLIGADGRLARIYSGNEWTPGTVLADLRAALRRP